MQINVIKMKLKNGIIYEYEWLWMKALFFMWIGQLNIEKNSNENYANKRH